MADRKGTELTEKSALRARRRAIITASHQNDSPVASNRSLQNCEDEPGWTDADGFGCQWYEIIGQWECLVAGDLYPNPDTGLTANQACCYCQSVAGGPAPVPVPTLPPVLQPTLPPAPTTDGNPSMQAPTIPPFQTPAPFQPAPTPMPVPTPTTDGNPASVPSVPTPEGPGPGPGPVPGEGDLYEFYFHCFLEGERAVTRTDNTIEVKFLTGSGDQDFAGAAYFQGLTCPDNPSSVDKVGFRSTESIMGVRVEIFGYDSAFLDYGVLTKNGDEVMDWDYLEPQAQKSGYCLSREDDDNDYDGLLLGIGGMDPTCYPCVKLLNGVFECEDVDEFCLR